jgi:hypothetical protein
MAVHFQANSIPDPAARGIIQQAVLEAIEGLPGEWLVTIGEIAHSPAWEIEITGPNNFFWQRIFFGHQEQDRYGDFVRSTVRAAVR